MGTMSNAPFWTAHATLYTTEADIEGHRLRLLALEKDCPMRMEYIDAHNIPAGLQALNPEKHYPFLTDKMLALWCPMTIESYIDERFPHPSFLPVDPKLRAQLRQVCAEFRTYYAIKPLKWLQTALLRLSDSLSSGLWLCGDSYTAADIALAPWLWSIRNQALVLPMNLQRYRRNLFLRPAFMRSVSEEDYAQAMAR